MQYFKYHVMFKWHFVLQIRLFGYAKYPFGFISWGWRAPIQVTLCQSGRYPFLDIWWRHRWWHLGPTLKISIHNAFATHLVWFLLFIPWDNALFVKEHRRNTSNKRKLACVSATQRKIWPKWIQRLCFFLCILNGVVFEFLQISGM